MIVNPINVEVREKHVSQILHEVAPALVFWSRELPNDPRTLLTGGASWIPFGRWDAPSPAWRSTPRGSRWPPSGCRGVGRAEYRHFSWSSPQILSIGPSMQTGAALVLARRFSQARFFDWLRDHEVTVAVGIPTVINMLLARPVAAVKADLPRLRFMTSSTAPLSVDKHVEFETTYGIPIVQLAGGTEMGFMCGNQPGDRRLLLCHLEALDASGVPVRCIALATKDRRVSDGLPHVQTTRGRHRCRREFRA